MNPITYSQFIADFPAFANQAVYTQAMITLYLNLAFSVLNAQRWAEYLNIGIELYTAHFCVLDAMANQQANYGGPPMRATGPISAKSAHDVSQSFDTQAAAIKDGSHWNMTTYGQRWLEIALMVGIGGAEVPRGFGYGFPAVLL